MRTAFGDVRVRGGDDRRDAAPNDGCAASDDHRVVGQDG